MRTHPSTHICTFSLFGCACTTQLLPPLSCVQARWRQLRSCAGALESITWAYRTRVAPFKPDALHPNADDDKAEQVLRMALVEWRQGLSAGADLNNTTLRKQFPESVFKHDQRQPKVSSWWQWCTKRFFKSCCGTKSCWTSAVRARTKAARADKAKHIRKEHNKEQCTAYCESSRSPCRPTLHTPDFTPTFAQSNA